MATGGGANTVTLLVTYSGQKLNLTIPTNAKVGDVIHKAVEGLKLKKEDLPLSLLYQGSPLPDDAPVEVSVHARVGPDQKMQSVAKDASYRGSCARVV